MEFHGQNQLGATRSAEGQSVLRAINPGTGQSLPGEFREATPAEVDRACALAEAAFPTFVRMPGKRRAEFLEAIAESILAREASLFERLALETGYPEGRLRGERDRTVAQLRMFAALLREGSWVQARIDRAQPQRPSGPKPDIRQWQMGLGPVAVFGASNFPQAFSTAGGDTASALAAGCPVIYKAHPAHPGTCEIYSDAIAEAARKTGMPDGVFSRLNGSQDVGMTLVKDARVRAVGFTGSYRGGRALFDAANARPHPIPVFAEMSSVNPLYLLPGAVRAGGERLAKSLSQSLTLGAGQFCTCPGLVIALAGPDLDGFLGALVDCLKEWPTGTMVHPAIKKGYDAALEEKRKLPFVERFFESQKRGACADTEAPPALFRITAGNFLAHPEAADEVFGPACLVVLCADPEEFRRVADSLPGQLTATVHGTEADLEAQSGLFASLERMAGRLIVNGFPTGVEVCPSMHHGGPFPAATFPHFTSVGTAAIYRFTRPVCYQDFPAALLPQELKEENPLGILRLVDGDYRR